MSGRLFYASPDGVGPRVERLLDLASRSRPDWRDFRPSPLQLLAQLSRLRVGIPDVFAVHAGLTPDRIAIDDGSARYTYAQVAAAIESVAACLSSDFGVGRGSPVVLAAENCADYIVAWFAGLRLGARIVHASFESTSDEFGWVFANSGASVAVVSERSVDAASSAAPFNGRHTALIAAGGLSDPRCATSIESLAGRGKKMGRSLPRAMPREAENVVYTSGTTGRPKGAVRDLGGSGIGELARITKQLGISTGDRQLIVSRLYHSAGQAFTILGAALGHTMFIHRRFDADAIVNTLEAERINLVFLVPTMTRRVLDRIDVLGRIPELSSLRAVVSGAAEFVHSLRQRAVACFGPNRVFDFYGATELGWITLIRGDEMMERPRSVGRPLSGHAIRIDAPEEAEVDGVLRSIGTIRTRSGQAMSGYLNNPDATSEASSEGWTTVEDTGFLDRDGYLYLAGRRRDLIISGGVNVYPAEVEDAIMRHPAVAEAAVIGLPDEEWGERVAAVVVLRQGAPDIHAVVAFVRQQLAPSKVPRRWHTLDELPRNPTGKVLKNELRKLYAS